MVLKCVQLAQQERDETKSMTRRESSSHSQSASTLKPKLVFPICHNRTFLERLNDTPIERPYRSSTELLSSMSIQRLKRTSDGRIIGGLFKLTFVLLSIAFTFPFSYPDIDQYGRWEHTTIDVRAWSLVYTVRGCV